jgi:ATP-binding cassette subfamily C protein LapB
MDVQNEAEVIAWIKSEMADRTLVIVTHRTSLLDLVDRVIVVDQGRIVADGPKSLLNRRGQPATTEGTVVATGGGADGA